MKAKLTLLLLSLVVVIIWIISFNPTNSLTIVGYRITTIDQPVVTVAAIATLVFSMVFFSRKYEEIKIQSDFWSKIFLVEIFMASLTVARYIFGGFHSSTSFWLLSIGLAYFIARFLYKLTVEGEGDYDID